MSSGHLEVEKPERWSLFLFSSKTYSVLSALQNLFQDHYDRSKQQGEEWLSLNHRRIGDSCLLKTQIPDFLEAKFSLKS